MPKRYKQYEAKRCTSKLICEFPLFDLPSGKRLDVFTLDEAVHSRMFSQAVLKKMETLKVGTKLHAGRQSNETDLVVMVLDEDGLDGEVIRDQEEIDKLTQQINEIAGHLLSKKAKLAKQLLKKKELNFKQKNGR